MGIEDPKFREFLDYDPDKFEGLWIMPGNGRGQLPTRVFNVLMRNSHANSGHGGVLVSLKLTDNSESLSAKALATIRKEEFQRFIRQFGEKSAEAVEKALNEILTDQGGR